MAKRGRKPKNWVKVQSVDRKGEVSRVTETFSNRVDLYRYLLRLAKELFDEEERVKEYEKDTSYTNVDLEC